MINTKRETVSPSEHDSKKDPNTTDLKTRVGVLLLVAALCVYGSLKHRSIEKNQENLRESADKSINHLAKLLLAMSGESTAGIENLSSSFKSTIISGDLPEIRQLAEFLTANSNQEQRASLIEVLKELQNSAEKVKKDHYGNEDASERIDKEALALTQVLKDVDSKKTKDPKDAVIRVSLHMIGLGQGLAELR